MNAMALISHIVLISFKIQMMPLKLPNDNNFKPISTTNTTDIENSQDGAFKSPKTEFIESNQSTLIAWRCRLIMLVDITNKCPKSHINCRPGIEGSTYFHTNTMHTYIKSYTCVYLSLHHLTFY